MELIALLCLHALALILSYSREEAMVKRALWPLLMALLLDTLFLFKAVVHQEASLILSFALITLVEFLTLVVFTFAWDYLAGEKNRTYFLRLILSVLASVVILLLSQSLITLYLSWCVIGLLVNKLLLFYPERPHTHAIAHKHFFNELIANSLMGVGFIMLAVHFSTLSIPQISGYLSTVTDTYSSVALLFIVLAFLIKTALMPFHGWLIQVMEVPTPVSALMHAGIVNLSGMVWLRLSPWWEHSPYLRDFVALVAFMSLLLSSIVMLTRVSIKVRLAWSTTAQMSFLLFECAQGWYEMAFIHLVGHSLYKAQAFLLSGNRVNEQPLKKQIKGIMGYVSSSFYSPLISLFISFALFVLFNQLLNTHFGFYSLPIDQMVFLSLLIAPALWLMQKDQVLSVGVRVVMQGLFILIFMLLHSLLHPLFTHQVNPTNLLDYLLLALLLTYIVHWLILSKQYLARSSTLNSLAYEGFYLDALWTYSIQRPLSRFIQQYNHQLSTFLGKLLHEAP
ncbi:MAG: hypothetical protein KGN31_07505 [Betaproteobacteria bacterium]|nr:hypothetical protein [Betaproteobacteria bacterium]MDE2424037.1 hypothetical protein [Betaproteobacteria bacterium]